ncbi:carbohydrate-binding module family 14 protein [Nannocystis sp.]|nr:carbohydrate-binding module family 14 protein [Nannocystis sp.]
MRTMRVLLLGVTCGLLTAASARAAEFTCPVDQGRYAHPHDGTKYIECLKGVPSVQSCAPGQVFDDLRKGCTAPGNVRKAPPRKPKAKQKKR